MAEFKQLGVAADHVTRNPAMRQEVLNVHPNAKFHDIKHRLNEDELIEVLVRGLTTATVVEPQDFYGCDSPRCRLPWVPGLAALARGT
jgi:hypothetical protein